jgi:hypothetical protein
MEFEQALSIRLCVPNPPAQLRYAGADQHYGQLILICTVKRPEQRAQLPLLDKLQIVDAQDECRPSSFRGFANRFEKLQKVAFEIATIGQAGFRLNVQLDIDFVMLRLQPLGECSERLQAASRETFGTHNPRQAQQYGVKFWYQRARERATLAASIQTT